MTRRRIALVVNPASGMGRAARVAHAVAERLGALATVAIHQASSPEGSRELIAGVAASCAAVVVLGGDGIVHVAAQSLAETSVPLGIIAAGTGNDVVDTLGLPVDPLVGADAVVAAVDAGTSRRLDLGRTAEGHWW